MTKLRALKSHFMASILFTILLGSLAVGEAAAATYYVAPTGSDSNGGSSTAPFKTIQKAANIVNAGDTVLVRDGVYTDTNGDNHIVLVSRGGTSSAFVTFRAQNRGKAVMDGQSNRTAFGWTLGAGVSNVIIDGFEIKGVSYSGIHSNGAGSNIRILRNHIHDIGRMCTSDAYGHQGIFVGQGTSNHVFDSNRINTIGRLPNCGAYYQNHDHGIYLSHTTNADVRNNLFYDCKSGWALNLFRDNKSVRVYNNTFAFANPYRDGHILLCGEGACGTLDIQNNVSYQPRGFFAARYLQLLSPSVILKNNLVYGASLADGAGCGDSKITCSANLSGQDPKFVNLTGRDFHIQSTSPGINKGLACTGRTTDYDGRALVGLPDIGAYEYGGSVIADTVAPSAPSLTGVN